MEEIKVYVLAYPGRKNLVMRYKCPLTGKQIARSTGTHRKSEAVKVAAKWEAELQEGRYQKTSRMPWKDFREYYEDATLEHKKTSTAANYASTFNAFELACRPQRVGDLTTAKITAFAAELRKERTRVGRDGKPKLDDAGKPITYHISESSVARHLRHMKAIARWAHTQELLPKVPRISIPGKASGAQRMKGRPITLEEFERILAKVPEVVGEPAADSWKFLLRGLWTTGLRLGEAMALRWDHQPGGVSVALDGKHSVLVFDADAQKSGKCQAVPLAPEAVQLLEPRKRDSGYVFNPKRGEGVAAARTLLRVGNTISAIGKAAGVVTDSERGKTATAHDLRRAFGSRWSKLVMPATLKEIMRHASIETTMTYYVGQSAKVTSAELWDVLGNKLGNTEPEKSERRQKTPIK